MEKVGFSQQEFCRVSPMALLHGHGLAVPFGDTGRSPGLRDAGGPWQHLWEGGKGDPRQGSSSESCQMPVGCCAGWARATRQAVATRWPWPPCRNMVIGAMMASS